MAAAANAAGELLMELTGVGHAPWVEHQRVRLPEPPRFLARRLRATAMSPTVEIAWNHVSNLNGQP
jgi:hypothetical protein